jgi:hypothetical protein
MYDLRKYVIKTSKYHVVCLTLNAKFNNPALSCYSECAGLNVCHGMGLTCSRVLFMLQQ